MQKNLLNIEVEEKNKKDIENVLKEIRGTARDGLSFLQVINKTFRINKKLQVRRSFWETSEPPVTAGRKGVKRSKSDVSRGRMARAGAKQGQPG